MVYPRATSLPSRKSRIVFLPGFDGDASLRDEFVRELSRRHEVRAISYPNRVLGSLDQYRAHAIPGLWGSSNRASLNKWFDTVGKSLHNGDRLFIYFTGHGGKGSTLSWR